MTANVTSTGGVSDKSYGSARRQSKDSQSQGSSSEGTAAAVPLEDQVLVISEDPELGEFVYTTIDRRTGAVLHRLNRSELAKLREDAAYAAGAVLSARA